MSLLNTIKIKLGISNTPANNFTLTAENQDGTMKLARGNPGETTQDILTVDAAGVVALPQTPNTQIGIGQTWQNVTGSRVLGTTYTNSTAKPIEVYVKGQCNLSQALTLTVGGIEAGYCQGGDASAFPVAVKAIVPSGATYVVTQVGGATLTVWNELR